MSKYSLTIGSFSRTSDYPLEAYYIFPTEESLKTFYLDEYNALTIHKGLLKIVESDKNGKQGLYWVVPDKTTGELVFEELISATNIAEFIEQLENLENLLKQETLQRLNSDREIWGTINPNEIPEDLNSILDLANAVTELKDIVTQEIFNTHKKIRLALRALAGATDDDFLDGCPDIPEYLKTLPYESLTAVAKELDFILHKYDEENPEINTWPELLYFLEGYTDQDQLKTLLENITNSILGDPLPAPEFRTLRGVEDYVRKFESESRNSDANLWVELNLTQLGVGLDSDGKFSPDLETYYLQDATSVMNALRKLDSLINKAINNVNLLAGETESTKLNIVKEETLTTIYARVKLSSEQGNDIQLKNDGLYYNVDTEYKDGILTIKVNGKVIQQHIIGLPSVVDDAMYSPDTEEIVIIFKLQSGDRQTVKIPVSKLISEWEVDNSQPTKVVVLEKLRIEAGGADKLSADVRLSSHVHNILEKDNNTLLVRGEADNIVTEGGLTVQAELDNLHKTDSDLQELISNLLKDLQTETNRAKEEETRLEGLITAETNRAELAEQQLQNNLNNAIEQEKNRAELVELNLLNQIDNLESRVTNNETNINELQENTTNLEKDLYNEVNRAKEEEHKLEDLIKTEETRARSSEKELQNTIEKEIEKEKNRAELEEQKLKDSIQNELTRAEQAESRLSSEISTLQLSIDLQSSDLTNRVESLEEFKLTHEKDYEFINDKVTELTDELGNKINSVTLHKNNERSYTIFVDGLNIGTIDIPSLAIIKDVSYSDGILTIKFNGDEEDIRIDLNQVLGTALEEVVVDVEQLKQDIINLQNLDVVLWNQTGENKAIFLEKDYAISAKFESDDTRTPIILVIEDKTHLGSNHFPTSIDSNVRPIVTLSNGETHDIAYLDDVETVINNSETKIQNYITELENRVTMLEEIIQKLMWKPY